MKKQIHLMQAILLVLVMGLFACGGGGSLISNSPSDVVKKGIKLFDEKKYDDVVKLYAKKDGTKLTEEESAKVKGLLAMAAKQQESKQGLKDVEIVEETIASDGNNATVKYKIFYNNGDSTSDKTPLVKIDGDWFMVLGN
jgi:hypothetical protein